MLAILHVGKTLYSLVQIEDAEMDRLQNDELLRFLYGFPVYYDSRERVFPRPYPDMRVEFVR
jgi:hypothetical protein